MPDVVGLRDAVAAPEIAPRGAAGVVAVLGEGPRRVRSREPRLTASIISMSAFFAQLANSLMPTWFVSFERQARSSRTGPLSFGPMPSSQS